MLLELIEGFEQGGLLLHGDLHAQDAGELPAETAHAAFQPVAAMVGHGARHRLDQPGAVGADDGHHQGNLHRGKMSGGMITADW